MKMATFQEFLTSGKIGEVQLGMRPEVVEQRLGLPDDRSVKRHPVEILRFGSLELAFKTVPQTDDTRLISVAIYFNRPKQQLPAALKFDDWTPTDATTEAEFRQFIASTGLDVHSKVDGQYTHLVLNSGGSIAFDDGQLHSVHFRRSEKGSMRRQMSVSLPENTLSQLRARAQHEHISLQELIERVLSTTK